MVMKDSKKLIYKIETLHYDKYFVPFTLEKHGAHFGVSEIAVLLPFYPNYSEPYKKSFS